MSDDVELTVLMPCLNEELTVQTCVEKAHGYLKRRGISGEVLVADNGSTDGSQALAEGAGARVVAIGYKGYGAALIGGIGLGAVALAYRSAPARPRREESTRAARGSSLARFAANSLSLRRPAARSAASMNGVASFAMPSSSTRPLAAHPPFASSMARATAPASFTRPVSM